jgi:uncharacterized membrane-anchored protein
MVTADAPDSYWEHQKAMSSWAWNNPEPETWPEDMDATTCGDWVDRAQAVLSLTDLPVTIRRVLMQWLSEAAHYCRKYDRVKAYHFDGGELELIQSLAGPYS